MFEPTLFAGLEQQVNGRLADLRTTALDLRPVRRHDPAESAGLVARTRGTVGRFLVSLGSQVAGQPQG